MKIGPYVLSVFCIVFFFNILWIFQGFDVTDTGFHLTNQALAFSKNPYPGIPMIIFLSDFVGGFWLWLYGSPSLFWAKLGWCLISALNALLVFLILKQFFSERNVFYTVLGVSILITALDNQEIIHYFSFPALLMTLGLYIFTQSLFSKVTSKKFKIYNFLLGFLFIPLVLSRISLILTILIPISLLGYKKIVGGTYPSKQAIHYAIAGVIISLIAFAIFYNYLGVTNRFLDSILYSSPMGQTIGREEYTLSSLAEEYIKDYNTSLKYALIVCALFLLITSIKEITEVLDTNVLITITLVLGALTSMNSNLHFFIHTIIGVLTELMLLIALIYLWRTRENKKLNLIVVSAIGVLIITPLGSGGGLYKSYFGFWLSLPLTVLIYSELKHKFKNKYIKNIFSVNIRTLAIVLLIIGCVLQYNYIYRDASREELDTEFNYSYLDHIYSSSKRVEVVDEALAEINRLTSKNDEVLMVNVIPMFYYLTETKPVFGKSWLFLDTKGRIEEECKKAIQNNKVPMIFVYAKINTADNNWPLTENRLRENDGEKLEYLKMEFIKKANYSHIFENEAFIIYKRPDR